MESNRLKRRKEDKENGEGQGKPRRQQGRGNIYSSEEPVFRDGEGKGKEEGKLQRRRDIGERRRRRPLLLQEKSEEEGYNYTRQASMAKNKSQNPIFF